MTTSIIYLQSYSRAKTQIETLWGIRHVRHGLSTISVQGPSSPAVVHDGSPLPRAVTCPLPAAPWKPNERLPGNRKAPQRRLRRGEKGLQVRIGEDLPGPHTVSALTFSDIDVPCVMFRNLGVEASRHFQ